MKTKMNSQSGLTITELLMTSVVGLTALIAFSTVLSHVFRVVERSKQVNMNNQVIVSLVEAVREDLSRHQVHYRGLAVADEDPLNPETLPMAWDSDKLIPTASCPDCPGRLGYVIEPLASRPGVFLVTMRMTHREMFPGEPRDYEFIVSEK